jgi:hypothetical protein
MKKTVYLLSALLFTVSTFIASPAKAQSDAPCNGDDPVSTTCPIPGGSTDLPINSGITYLLIAGVIIGTAAVKRHKAALPKA